MKYACIAQHRQTGDYAVRLMCRVLQVTPSGFYAWAQRGGLAAPPTARATADAALTTRTCVVSAA